MAGVFRGPRTRPLLTVVFATILSAAAPARGLAPQAGVELERVYRGLLLRYRAGEVGPVVQEAAGWDERRLEALRATPLLRFVGWIPGEVDERLRLVETAAAVHTRAATSRAEALGPGASHAHLDLARFLIARLAANGASGPFVRAWYVAVAIYLSGAVNPSGFLAHAADTRRLYPSDPAALVALGIGYERVADSPFRPAAPSAEFAARKPGEEPSAAIVAVIERTRWLDVATSCYRDALAASPDDSTARLRLGRVLVASEDYSGSLPELARAEREAATPAERFLAALFLGVALEATDRRPEAADAYRRARLLFPSARSATFALSEVEERSGNLHEAAAILDEFCARVPSPRLEEDPWWVTQHDWWSRLDKALLRLDEALARGPR